MNTYSFALRPEDYQPSGNTNFRKIDNVNLNLYSNKIHYEKNKFYFSDFGGNQREFKRKYNNNWDDLREYVDFNDIKLIDNELPIINLNYKSESLKLFATNYNVLRIMSGMGGLVYTS